MWGCINKSRVYRLRELIGTFRVWGWLWTPHKGETLITCVHIKTNLFWTPWSRRLAGGKPSCLCWKHHGLANCQVAPNIWVRPNDIGRTVYPTHGWLSPATVRKTAQLTLRQLSNTNAYCFKHCLLKCFVIQYLPIYHWSQGGLPLTSCELKMLTMYTLTYFLGGFSVLVYIK